MYIITREGEEETYTSFTRNNIFLPLARFRGPEEENTGVKDVHNNTRRRRRDMYFSHREQPFPSSSAISRARRNTTTLTTTMKNAHSKKKRRRRDITMAACLPACLPVDRTPERKEWNKKALIKPAVSLDSI
jgi:hypothetical protein